MSSDFFLYLRSDNLPAARRFYTDLLGLTQVWDEPDSVAYTIGPAVQLYLGAEEAAAPPVGAWSFQPGWVHGLGIDPPPAHAPVSWSIALSPEDFHAAVARLQTAQVPALRPAPFWVGYWSFVVRDPMGHTVELSDPHSPGPTERDAAHPQPSTNRPTT